MRKLLSVLFALAVAGAVPVISQQGREPDTTSKNPPPGAPWLHDFFAARDAAVAAGVPIFVYSTKTY